MGKKNEKISTFQETKSNVEEAMSPVLTMLDFFGLSWIGIDKNYKYHILSKKEASKKLVIQMINILTTSVIVGILKFWVISGKNFEELTPMRVFDSIFFICLILSYISCVVAPLVFFRSLSYECLQRILKVDRILGIEYCFDYYRMKRISTVLNKLFCGGLVVIVFMFYIGGSLTWGPSFTFSYILFTFVSYLLMITGWYLMHWLAVLMIHFVVINKLLPLATTLAVYDCDIWTGNGKHLTGITNMTRIARRVKVLDLVKVYSQLIDIGDQLNIAFASFSIVAIISEIIMGCLCVTVIMAANSDQITEIPKDTVGYLSGYMQFYTGYLLVCRAFLLCTISLAKRLNKKTLDVVTKLLKNRKLLTNSRKTLEYFQETLCQRPLTITSAGFFDEDLDQIYVQISVVLQLTMFLNGFVE